MKTNDLAPILLFVYNRPWHTQQTLEALSANDYADQSELYIYADGPKCDASRESLEKIEQVRKIIASEKWCKAVHIKEREENIGLASNVIDGVTEVLNKKGKCIILEDDIVTHSQFLVFMNTMLQHFNNSENLAGISGWSYANIKCDDPIYMSRIGSCWGWATWREKWKLIDLDGTNLLNKIREANRISEFNADDQYKYYRILENQIKGINDSWAVRFYASYFLENQLFVFPAKGLVSNIGMDGSGTHKDVHNKTEGSLDFTFSLKNFELVEETELPEIRKQVTRALGGRNKKSWSISRYFKNIILSKFYDHR